MSLIFPLYSITLTIKSNTIEGIMRITQKGQVTIPENIRQKYNLLPYAEVEFVEEDGRVYIRLAEQVQRGGKIVGHLRGTASAGLTTDDILKLTRGET